jgi:hypothetical protein
MLQRLVIRSGAGRGPVLGQNDEYFEQVRQLFLNLLQCDKFTYWAAHGRSRVNCGWKILINSR